MSNLYFSFPLEVGFLTVLCYRCFAWMYIVHYGMQCLQKPEEGAGPLELELEMVESHHMGAGN